MKKIWKLLILGFAVVAAPTMASAQSLGLKFAATDPDAATSSLNPADVAGVVPQANWNNLTGNNGTGVNSLVLSNGLASSATVTWTSPNTWRSTTGNNAFPAGPNRVLTAGYLDTGNTTATAVSVTVNNIDAAVRTPAYDVYVYFVTDSGENRGGGYTLNDGVAPPVVKYGSTMAMPSTFIEDPGTDPNLTLDGTYLRFRRMTGTSFTLTGDTTLTTPNGFRAPINAIQIHARPRAGDVNGDGSVDINDFHIIRGNLFKTGQNDEQGDIAGAGGIVDFEDYREWKRFASPAAVAASWEILGIPEPGTAALVAAGAAMVACARRSRRRSSV